MTQELIEAKINTMEADIKDIKSDLKKMPDAIASLIQALT